MQPGPRGMLLLNCCAKRLYLIPLGPHRPSSWPALLPPCDFCPPRHAQATVLKPPSIPDLWNSPTLRLQQNPP